MKKIILILFALLFLQPKVSISAENSQLEMSAKGAGVQGSFSAINVQERDQSSFHSGNGEVDNNVNKVEFSVTGSFLDEINAVIKYKGNRYELFYDNLNQKAEIKGFGKKGEKLILDQNLKSDLTQIFRTSQLTAPQIMSFQSDLDSVTNKTFLRFFEFLSTYPIGTPIHQIIQKDDGAISVLGWENLCSSMGRQKKAIWDVTGVGTKTKYYKVGGHGFCAGRCGAGCPMFGDGQYTQDCLNHDACADVEGQQLGACSNEWTAAADDFWFSPDCTTPPSN